MMIKNRMAKQTVCLHALTILSWEIRKIGVYYRIEEDPEEMTSFLLNNKYIVNPTFNKGKSKCPNVLWIGARDYNGKLVGCHAERLFSTTDFIKNQIGTGSLWNHKRPVNESLEIKFQNISKIKGLVSYAGSMFIDNSFRNKRLSFILPHISRAIMFIKYRNHFCTGIVREALASTKLPKQNYGFSNVDLLYHGKLPGSALMSENVYLCWMNQHDLLRSLSNIILGYEKVPLNKSKDEFFIPQSVQMLLRNLIS